MGWPDADTVPHAVANRHTNGPADLGVAVSSTNRASDGSLVTHPHISTTPLWYSLAFAITDAYSDGAADTGSVILAKPISHMDTNRPACASAHSTSDGSAHATALAHADGAADHLVADDNRCAVVQSDTCADRAAVC
jgi:hypothetical protein